ncbi:hypothetical protein C8Q80DRAFT_1155673 [Daedaleopsis nitida]|nr:hypothetical protein C8Q80DRAFT_1155673 [Daedaleopsis nitida]
MCEYRAVVCVVYAKVGAHLHCFLLASALRGPCVTSLPTSQTIILNNCGQRTTQTAASLIFTNESWNGVVQT